MEERLVPKDLCKAYTSKEILKIEKKYMIPAVTHYFEDPILIVGILFYSSFSHLYLADYC